MWSKFLDWLATNRIGDLSGVVGLCISVIGFLVTLVGVVRSRKSAEKAAKAAADARESIREFETVVEFAEAISLLEEIRRAHRQEQWALLPDRHAAIRKRLLSLKASRSQLSETHLAAVQNALVNITNIEQVVERGLQNSGTLRPARFNAILSGDVDDLFIALNQLKMSRAGA